MLIHYNDLVLSAVKCAHRLPYVALLVMIGIDFITGMSCALALKKLNSSINAKGLIRKAVEAVLPLLVFPIFDLVNYTSVVDAFIIGFLIAETVSLLENLTALGVPIPKQITQYLDDDKLADKAQKFINDRK